MKDVVLVHLAAGLGNIVLATPLLVALGRMGLTIDLWLSADYPETEDLFRGWATVRRLVSGVQGEYGAHVPAVPPFYWRRFAGYYARLRAVVGRPPDALFFADEQEYYLAFARALGYDGPAPQLCLPVPPPERAADAATVVLAPGCKSGEMAAKRWPWFPELAARFDDVVVVGSANDVYRFDGSEMVFPAHARVYAGRLHLRETVELIAGAGVAVANDSGLGHVAAALGVPTVLLFGPTPDRELGRMPANVTVLRAGLPCEPCWFAGRRFHACGKRIDCLKSIAVEDVVHAVSTCLVTGSEPCVR